MRQPASQSALKKFYDDQEVYDEVREFMFAHLDQLGLTYIYLKESTIGVADAKIVLENAFKQLDDMFGEKTKSKKPKNEAR